MTDLRTVFTTKEQMTSLRDTVKYTFTAGNTASFLKNIITDIKLDEQLQKAIGLKKDKPLKARLADDITSSLLGFHNANEMHAFYNVVPPVMFNKETYLHKNRHQDCPYNVFVEDGVIFSPLDAIALFYYDFNLSRDEELDFITSVDNVCTLENIPQNDNMLTSSDNISGMAFDISGTNDEYLPDMLGSNIEANLDVIQGYIQHVASGQSLTRYYENDTEINLYEKSEYQTLSVPQAALESKYDLLKFLLDFKGNDFAENLVGKEVDLSILSTASDIKNIGLINLDKGYEVFYNLEQQTFIVAKNKKPIIGIALYAAKQDARCKKLWEMLKK